MYQASNVNNFSIERQQL